MHSHFVSVEILRNYLCQMNVENGLSFIIVNIEDSVIHSSHLNVVYITNTTNTTNSTNTTNMLSV
jgi:hypothetical protein